MDMRVAVLPGDTGACGHYRLIWTADAVRRIRPDWEITVVDPRSVKVETTRGGPVVHGLPVDELDLLVTQRVGSPVVADMCAHLQARGVAVVMDMDDAMWALDPANVAYSSWNTPPRGGRIGLHWSVTDRAAESADMVTVTTGALAERYGTHGRVEVLPNRVPRMALTAARVRAGGVPVAGWSGLLATHPNDPQVIGDAMARAAAAGWVRPAVMGDAYRTGKLWRTRVADIDTADLGVPYYRQLARLDVGLVPLDLTGSSAVFNAGKSSLKALEMAATGAAVIASPSPANLEFAQEVPVRIASSPAEWLRHLGELADPQVRTEQVEKQLAAVEAGWVLQDRAEDWAAAWVAAVDNRRDAR